jgi:Ca-activated chloride channel family protein
MSYPWRNLLVRGRYAALALPFAAVACSGDDGAAGTGAGEFGDEGDWTGGDEGTSGASAEGGVSTSGTSATGAGDEGGTSGADDGDDGQEPDESEGGSESSTGEPVCDDQEPVALYLSPDDSNSMSSAVQAREAVLSSWNSLGSVALRPWEFFNYYSFDYPPAPAGTVVVTPSLSRNEADPEGEYVMQIGVSSELVADEARAPMDITLVLDTSGSMEGHPMEMLKQTCLAIAASLQAGDTVSMVTWNTENTIRMSGYGVTGPDDALVLAEIDELTADGGTNLYNGLVEGYALADAAFEPGRINRMVLISDGGANVGITEVDLIAQHAGSNDGDGIYMVGVGVGTADTYNDELMDDVTDAGKGASVFVPSQAEAWKVFNDGFVNIFGVAARDVQVRLDLPPGFEIVKFSAEEVSTDPTEVEPQHLSPNDTMVFHQRIRTCAPALVADDTPITVTARFKHATTFEQQEVIVTTSFGELLAVSDPQLLKGAAVMAYTDALKASQGGDGSLVAPAMATVIAAEQALPGDEDLAEIRDVLENM